VSELFFNLFTTHQGPLVRNRTVKQNSVCHENAFHYLLQAEAKRSQRSGHSYHIVFVYRSEVQGAIMPMPSNVSSVLFDALAESLRDTDYIGWYREGRVIGGVLTVVGQDSIAEVRQRIHQRVMELLKAKLGSEESNHFHITLCRQDELQNFLPVPKMATLH
jgi:hypothetical protein